MVRTVFVGATVDSFEAEIVGVLSGGKAEGDMIIARATTPRVVQSGVAQGMSGSPVYVGGKLIGALSSGWSFTKEPLFGITPIGEMLAVFDLPRRSGSSGSSGTGGLDLPGQVRDLSVGPFRWSDAGPASPAIAPSPPSGGLVPLALPLSGSLQREAAAVLEPLFGASGFRLVPGGRQDPASAATTLEPGDAVAVDVLRGDLQLSAIGTVTYRDGDRILIFGHPFFQAGDVRLPLSTATITTIVASSQSS
ncbi:MAG: SpoIVB peptidase S55 domain-containing protein, partial [Candidatus Eisenbacteria bacterium]